MVASFTKMATLGTGRLGALCVLAAAAFGLMLMGLSWMADASFLWLAATMSTLAATLVTGAGLLLLALLLTLLARRILTYQPLREITDEATAKASLGSGADPHRAAQIANLLAAGAQEQIRDNPQSSLVLAALLGVAAGVAPRETESVAKYLMSSLSK